MTEYNLTKYLMEAELQLGKDVERSLVNSAEYRRVIESLRYLTRTHPDLSYAIGIVNVE